MTIRALKIAGFCALLCLLIAGSAQAAGSEQTYIGTIVKLSGYSYGSSTVYLFLTGPNLPANGVALDNIYLRADQGGFTRVDVDSNDRWEYDWNTGSAGRLDAGSYMVWAVNEPYDLSHIGTADYRTIPVVLGVPSVSAGTTLIPGSMDLRSDPDNASVVLDTRYRGRTPLVLNSLDPGTYNVTFSRFGYGKFSTLVMVKPGGTTEVTAVLVPWTGMLIINTSPAGARLTIDGTDAGVSPVTLPSVIMGNHLINATKEGYLPADQPVYVIENRTVTANIVLQPAHDPELPTLPAAGLLPATFAAACIAVLLEGIRWLRSR